jgi:16S rRNA (uracil1498-N3)-methyltransferase
MDRRRFKSAPRLLAVRLPLLMRDIRRGSLYNAAQHRICRCGQSGGRFGEVRANRPGPDSHRQPRPISLSNLPNHPPMPRFFVTAPLAVGELCILPEAVVRHVQVLRLQTGDMITLFNGEGGAYEAELVGLEKKHASAQLRSFQAEDLEPPYSLTLAQGVAGGDKMDWLIEKAVELGVSRVLPLTTAKSVVRLQGERAVKRRDHWQALTRAACEQCGRNRVPQVEPLADLRHWLAALAQADGTSKPGNGALKLMLSPRGAQQFDTLPRAAPSSGVILLIGPEGGLSETEEDEARACGFLAVGLGPRILRTETAGIAVLAALAARWGGW